MLGAGFVPWGQIHPRQSEFPYKFPSGRIKDVRSVVGQATAQHLRPDIGHLVTYLLFPGWYPLLLEAFYWFSLFFMLSSCKEAGFWFPKLRLQLAWSERSAHCLWEGDARGDQVCPLLQVFDCNSGLSRSGTFSLSPGLLTLVLSMPLSCLMCDSDKGRGSGRKKVKAAITGS